MSLVVDVEQDGCGALPAQFPNSKAVQFTLFKFEIQFIKRTAKYYKKKKRNGTYLARKCMFIGRT